MGTLVATVKLSELTERKDVRDEYTDMFLIVKNSYGDEESGDPTVINIHSGVLRVASPFFMRALDELEAKRRPRRSHKLEYVLTTPYPWIIQRIVRYIYSKDYCNVREPLENLVPLYHECTRFQLEELKRNLLKIFQSQTSLEIISQLACVADASGETVLARDCGRVLADASYAIFSTRLHLNLGTNGLVALLASDNVQLDEVQVFEALCHYMESKPELHTPFASEAISDVEKDLLHLVRFCSMAPNSINEFKTPNLDDILLKATLRMLLKEHMQPRAFPWLENEHYQVNTFEGLYPVMLTRVAGGKLASGRSTNEIETNDNSGSFAYNLGGDRELSLAHWAFQIVKTKAGNFGFGIALQSAFVGSQSCTSLDIGYKRPVYFIDFYNNCKKSGSLDAAYKFRSSNVSETFSTSQKLQANDLVLVKVQVTLSCIHLQVSVHGTDISQELSIPYKCNMYLGEELKKPSVVAAPFLCTFDVGDALCIPTLLGDLQLS